MKVMDNLKLALGYGFIASLAPMAFDYPTPILLWVLGCSTATAFVSLQFGK